MTIHRIRRQRWQVAAPDAATAFAMRSLLRRTQDSTLLPALAEAFDAVDVGEREMYIPRLEVRLDFSSAEGLDRALPERLRDAVRQALGEALQGGGAGPAAEAPRDLPPGERLVAYLAGGRLAWFDAGRESTETLALLAGEAARWTASLEAGWARLLAVPVAAGHGLAEVFFRSSSSRCLRAARSAPSGCEPRLGCSSCMGSPSSTRLRAARDAARTAARDIWPASSTNR